MLVGVPTDLPPGTRQLAGQPTYPFPPPPPPDPQKFSHPAGGHYLNRPPPVISGLFLVRLGFFLQELGFFGNVWRFRAGVVVGGWCHCAFFCVDKGTTAKPTLHSFHFAVLWYYPPPPSMSFFFVHGMFRLLCLMPHTCAPAQTPTHMRTPFPRQDLST